MLEERQEENIPPTEETSVELDGEPMPPTRTIFTVLIVIGIVLVSGFVWYAMQLNTDPEDECVYRGGTWVPADDECVFESGQGGTTAQVGMEVHEIEVTIPDVPEVTQIFTDVEIGAPHTSTQTFASGRAQGAVSLAAELGRVEKTTKDLVMPFAVNYGGSGTFTYLGVFEKEGERYVLRDSALVGDRVAPQSLMLTAHDAKDAFSARLAYRDRRDGEAYSDVPTEPRTHEAVIYNHQIDANYTLGRDGLYYEQMVRVSEPLLRAQVASPLTVRGIARGTWFFEASFPVVLVDWDGKILAEGVAQAQGDWMTEDFVPFAATLSFTLPADIPYTRGTLILKKDNPSGLPENDDAFEIPVTFKK